MLLYCDCPHFNKDTRLAKYTVCKKLLTYVHPQTPKLFRNIKVPPYTQGHEISKVRGIAVISLKYMIEYILINTIALLICHYLGRK